MDFWSLLFSFTGRVNRAPYWLATIGLIAAVLVVVMIAFTVAGRSAIAIIVAGVAFLLLIWVTLALITKRLHDRNKSAWWLLLFYILPGILPALGLGNDSANVILGLVSTGISIWAFVEIGCLRGTAGPNSYGADPLQVRGTA